MRLDYKLKPTLVKKILYVTHKEKKSHFDLNEHAHSQNANELIYVDYGKVILSMNNERMVINTGECVLISGGTGHSFIGESESAVDFLNIMFFGNVPANLFEIILEIQPKSRILLEKINNEVGDQLPYYKENIASCLSQLIVSFVRQKENAVPWRLPKSATQLNYQSEVVKRALNFIGKEYPRPLGLKQLSTAIGCSESYLRALIRKETGMNFSTILQKERVSVAKHFLRESTYSLDEIALSVGYNSMPFFFKIFKRWTGMTPMDYSRSLGKTDESLRD